MPSRLSRRESNLEMAVEREAADVDRASGGRRDRRVDGDVVGRAGSVGDVERQSGRYVDVTTELLLSDGATRLFEVELGIRCRRRRARMAAREQSDDAQRGRRADAEPANLPSRMPSFRRSTQRAETSGRIDALGNATTGGEPGQKRTHDTPANRASPRGLWRDGSSEFV